MVNGIDKKALFRLKAEPYLKPISDLGVGFYNLDENTAKIEFQLYNTKGPLLISENNIDAYAYFESANGSASDVIDLEVLDGLNGVVGITLDKEFLQASTDTKVKGQVYVGVNNVDNNPEYNEVAVFREFTFEVADALINKISSFTKIEYIRMFDQLKARILQRVEDIEQAIANGADYVAEMKTVKAQAITQINQTVTEGKAYIDSVIAQAQTNINDAATSAINDVNTTKDNAISAMDNKSSEKVDEVENISNDAIKHVDDKLVEFNTNIEENSFVQPSDLDNKLTELQWQKFKILQDNGDRIRISDIDPTTLPTGFYQMWNMKNPPYGGDNNAQYWNVDVVTAYDNIKQIIATTSYDGRMFKKNIHKGQDRGWKELTINQTDTGWIPFTIINGGRTNPSYEYGGSRNGFGCAYRTVVNGTVTTKYLRVNADTIGNGQVIAQLPNNFAKNPQVSFIRTPLMHNGSSIIIENNGEVKAYINNSEEWQAIEGKYIYGEISWID